MKLELETTDKAVDQTRKALRSLADAFRGSNQFKNGEVTVNLIEV